MTHQDRVSKILGGVSRDQHQQMNAFLEGFDSLQLKNLQIIESFSSTIDVQSTITKSMDAIISSFGSQAKILESIQPFTQISENFTEQYSNIFSMLEESVKIPFANIVSTSIAFNSLFNTEAFDDFRKRLELDENTVEAFKASGWPIAPSMPGSLRRRVLDLYREGRVGYSTNSVLGHYRREDNLELKRAIGSWEDNQLFSPRMHILRDALQAHCDGRYTLSVPALMPQVEGILVDFVNGYELEGSIGKIKKVYEAAIGDPLNYDLPRWLIASVLLYHLDKTTYVFTSFDAELKKSVSRRRITRHTVLHGIAINYDRPSTSLRTILILDALAGLRSQ